MLLPVLRYLSIDAVVFAMTIGFYQIHRLILSCYSKRISPGVIILLLSLILPEVLRADIKASPLVVPTVLSKPVRAEVTRGGQIEIAIPVVSVSGGDVSVQVSKKPNCGTLQLIDKRSGTVPVFRYRNNAAINSPEDSFEFRIKVQGQPWSTHTGLIRIKNPPGTLSVVPEKIDFGTISIGSSARKTMLLSNNFGAPVSGVLLLPSPWSLVGDGAFSLAENQVKAFTVLFTPVKAISEVAELKVAPELSNFPAVPLFGQGVIPFLIDTNSAIVTKEHPQADFRITNASTREMRIGWDDDTGLLASPPVIIPPGGASKVWISIAPLALDSEERKVVHPSLREGNFFLPLEIVALGPKGKLILKADEKTFSCKAGAQVTLHGVIESTSSMERTLQLRCPVKDGDSDLIRNVTIAPHASQPFVYSWSSLTPGPKTLKASLFESGRLLQEVEWHAMVIPPEKQIHQSSQSVSKVIAGVSANSFQAPKSQIIRLSRKDSGCVAAKLSSVLEPGVFANSLLLKWLYLGDGVPAFIVEEKIKRNVLTDRTGENPGEIWRRLDVKPRRENGEWVARMPMPWPGIHIYRVYPSGSPVVIMSEVMVPVTWSMFLRPAARAGLLILFALCIVKVLRERL